MFLPEENNVIPFRRWVLAIVITLIGYLLLAGGAYLETRNPRTNVEDQFAWLVLYVGVATTTAGLVYPFLRLSYVLVVAFLAPGGAFGLALVLFWGFIVFNAIFRF